MGRATEREGVSVCLRAAGLVTAPYPSSSPPACRTQGRVRRAARAWTGSAAPHGCGRISASSAPHRAARAGGGGRRRAPEEVLFARHCANRRLHGVGRGCELQQQREHGHIPGAHAVGHKGRRSQRSRPSVTKVTQLPPPSATQRISGPWPCPQKRVRSPDVLYETVFHPPTPY
jgi:hypothetical protein